MLLTNDGLYWDGWYVFDWVKSRNWQMLHHFYDSLGLPLFGWVYRVFAFAPSLIATFMWATVLCFFANGVLTYQLGLKLANLTRGEALAIALLAQAMPLFTAAQDFIMFCFVFTHTLFLLSALLIAMAMRTTGWRQWCLRVIGVVGFYLSFSNAALLVYYGGFYILFFFSYRRISQLSFPTVVLLFVRRYPELLCLPLLAWRARTIFTPQYGWYEHYNKPDLSQVPTNLESFLRNVPSYTFETCTAWISAHPMIILTMIIGAMLWYVLGPKNGRFEPSTLLTFHFLWFGAILLFLSVLPFAAAGKDFGPVPTGVRSRHCILAPLPAAILVFMVVRLGLIWRFSVTRRLVAPVVASLSILLGIQIPNVYVNERAEWLFSRSLLYNAVRSEDVRDSSVIFLPGDFSLVNQTVYGLYAFKIAFGGMDRFVTNRGPLNGTFFTRWEIDGMLVDTTMLPNEFTHINRNGIQIRVDASRNRGNATDWQIVRRYLWLRYFGDRREFESFLGSLCTIRTSTLSRPN